VSAFTDQPLFFYCLRRRTVMLLPQGLAACADMTPTQERALTGTAAGAGIGAIDGSGGLGAAAGAGAGLIGGLLTDRSRQAQERALQEGFAAGQQRP
jgi:hypothetical protein